jgi:hypothetical protein
MQQDILLGLLENQQEFICTILESEKRSSRGAEDVYVGTE